MNNPLDVLKGFIDEMFQFNESVGKAWADNKFDPERDEKLLEDKKVIFSKYLTDKERVYSMSLSHSTPSTYNLETNEILSCNIDGKKAYIEIQETVGFKNKIKYTLHLKKDGWRIYKKEAYLRLKDKWESRIF